MVLDQTPWHRSRRVQRYLEAHPEIELIWLPAYTPELNPVEFVWKLLKGRVVKGRYFANLAELKRAIRKFFVYLYNMPSRWRHLLRRFIPRYPWVENYICHGTSCISSRSHKGTFRSTDFPALFLVYSAPLLAVGAGAGRRIFPVPIGSYHGSPSGRSNTVTRHFWNPRKLQGQSCLY
jgi:hypothetical protein